MKEVLNRHKIKLPSFVEDSSQDFVTALVLNNNSEEAAVINLNNFSKPEGKNVVLPQAIEQIAEPYESPPANEKIALPIAEAKSPESRMKMLVGSPANPLNEGVIHSPTRLMRNWESLAESCNVTPFNENPVRLNNLESNCCRKEVKKHL